MHFSLFSPLLFASNFDTKLSYCAVIHLNSKALPFIFLILISNHFCLLLLCYSANTTYLISLKISFSTNSLGTICTASTPFILSYFTLTCFPLFSITFYFLVNICPFPYQISYVLTLSTLSLIPIQLSLPHYSLADLYHLISLHQHYNI